MYLQKDAGQIIYRIKDLYTRKLRKNDRFVHVIGTHLQAEDSMCGKTSPASVRTNQLKEIQDFIKNKKYTK